VTAGSDGTNKRTYWEGSFLLALGAGFSSGRNYQSLGWAAGHEVALLSKVAVLTQILGITRWQVYYS
jgi:hypothetical protein